MTDEHDEILKRLVDARARRIERKKAELNAEIKSQDDILTAYWDGVYDALKEIEKT